MSRHNRDLNRIAYSVRATQVVLQYGVGAMIDFPGQTLMTAAPWYWSDAGEDGYKKISDHRLENHLHVDYFGMPKGASVGGFVSYVRFPEWYYCPSCHRLQKLSDWEQEYRGSGIFDSERDSDMVNNICCTQCDSHPHLIVARLVTACEKGHIDNFPWVEWTHKRSVGGEKTICQTPHLKIHTSGSSSDGLESIRLECRCGAKSSLLGAFTPGALSQLGITCKGRHPWKNTIENCNEAPKTMQRGSSSIYFPVVESSLVIPPYSNFAAGKIQGSNSYEDFINKLHDLREKQLNTEAEIAELIDKFAQRIAEETKETKEVVTSILSKEHLPRNDKSASTFSISYRAEEYDVLSGTAGTVGNDKGEFEMESQKVEEYAIPYIKRISLIHRVREVQALVGFTRVKPFRQLDGSSDVDETGDVFEYVNIKSRDERKYQWYPACEARGEGIFIEFDERYIDKWQSDNATFLQKRVDILNKNYVNSLSGKNSTWRATAKFLLLHTIAHLLIKQLSFECGYSIASLKERLYCSEKNDGKIMSGIFIYTSGGDSEGTLGGLVRQGYPDTLPDIFRKAIESAVICSNDPVCSLSEGQGRDSLNLAACYSCTMIPETSCERFNTFLDRGVVVGTFDNASAGFYSKEINNESTWEPTVMCSAEKALPPEENSVEINNIGDKPGSFDELIDQLRAYATSQCDREFVDRLQTKENEFSGNLPSIAAELSFNGSCATCILLWESDHIAVFFSDYKGDYDNMIGSGWTLVYTENSGEVDVFFRR